MAYNEVLTQRLRAALSNKSGVSEKRMMGAVGFLLYGNLLAGADSDKNGRGRFMFRVGKEGEAEALARSGATVMEQGGRRMSGLIFVREEMCDDRALKDWIKLAIRFVGALPPK